MQKLKITNKRALKLAALYDEPEGGGPHPLVILLHGNTGWKEEEHLATLAAGLAAAGIAALRFDAPGSGESEGTWADDYCASNYLAATADVYNHAIQKLSVDPNRIGIWGHSLGGMLAVYAAAQHQQQFKAVCGCEPSGGGMSLLRTPKGTTQEKNGGISVKTEIFGTIWLPASYFRDRQRYNTAIKVKELHLPLLLIAGTTDELVPAAEVHRIFHAANEPKQLLEFPMDHFYKRNLSILAQVNTVTVNFFHEALL